MKHLTPLLVPALMLCLAMMIRGGWAAETQAASSGAKPEGIRGQTRNSTEETLSRMVAELKLTQDQAKQVRNVLDSNEQKMRAIRARKSLTPQEFGAQGREARAASDKQFREILRPEQYETWQKILAQRGTRRRQESPAGAPHPSQPSPPQAGSDPAGRP